MTLQRGKNLRTFLVTLLAITFIILLSGCGKETEVYGVSFLEDTVTIEKSETYALSLLGAEDKEIKWKSEDESKATIVDGVVYAKKKGNTKIFAYIGEASVSCDLVITDNKYVPTIELNEPDAGVNLEKDGTYILNPVLAYNGNTYTDVEYTYSADGEAIKVDDEGKITASEWGEGMVCVTAEWRDHVVETSLEVNVVDVSTSIEVCEKNFDIYLNGEGGEYPSKADLGITVFDNDVQVKNYGTSVRYVENAIEGDVEGAATIKNGVVYASKLGTTHFVAEYTSALGVVVRSTTFTVNVLQTPADKYMTQIEGKEFEFFFEPIGPDNSVVWDEEMKAFHLINKDASGTDARGFIINKEYLENIIKYTKAESISFEIMTDGISCGFDGDDTTIYQSFYPDWYTDEQLQRYAFSGKWTEVEVFFDDIPKDAEGKLKAIFLLNAIEGIYVRNIKLWLPGEDRTGYDPNHNYLEDIKGTEYEFFIEPLSDKNSVKWDEETQSFHLINKITEGEDTRGFIFNQDYLYNIIKHTDAESIAFEYKTDGIASGIVDQSDPAIYQGFWPSWWDANNVTRVELTGQWTSVEIFFDDIPKDADGNMKTIFLMNTIEGLSIRNIKLYRPGEDRTDYNQSHNYLEDIKGTEYEFFIEPLSDKNSVKWDEEAQAFHLINKTTEAQDTRGFIFNWDYLYNIVNHTDAESIAFEYRTDGIASGIEDKGDPAIYQGFWPSWWDVDNVTRVELTGQWTSVEIFFDDIPKDADGNMKTIFLMNTVEGLSIRNIKLYRPGEARPGDESDTPIGPTYDYMADIEGEEYEFFIEPLGIDNSVAWDETMNSFHLTNLVSAADDTRGFIFNKEYLEGIIENTDAVSISFEYKTDGKASGIEDTTSDPGIYRGFWPSWWDVDNMTRVELTDQWTSAEIILDDIPLDANGDIKTIFLMNTVEGMYIRNIKVNVPKVVEPSETCDFFVDVEAEKEPVVLQLTDTQIIDASQERYEDRLSGITEEYWAKDQVEERCYDYLTETINQTQPDLILITGDLVYGEFDDSGEAFKDFVEFMESFAIPWAPIFGNHEGETELGIDAYCDMLEAAEHCLFKQRELTGNGNYTVGIRQNGELKRVFFMLDSNGYSSPSEASLANGHTTATTGFGKDQIEWYTKTAQIIKEESPNVKISFAFHIQLAVFEEAYAKYGFSNSATEVGSDILTNPINIDLLDNKTEGDFGYLGRKLKGPWDSEKTVWEGIKALGVDSILVGHEHCNSASVVYEGVRFQYGQKSSTYDRANYMDESTGVITGAYYATTTPLVGGTVLPLTADGSFGAPYIYLCENTGGDTGEEEYDYLADIKGEEYEFFIEPLGEDNSVVWDEETSSFHLINKTTAGDDRRGFIFNKEYLEGIMANTNAVSISFEYKTDGIASGIEDTTSDPAIYRAFWPSWWDTNNMNRAEISAQWTSVEIFFDAIPTDANGDMKTIFLMNTVEGTYVRNIEVNVPEKDYLADIEGAEYEFFIEPLGEDNSVVWDEETGSFHLTNKVAFGDDTRGFIFNKEYLEAIIANTDAVSISFEYKTDNIASGIEDTTSDPAIYQAFWPNWWDANNMKRMELFDTWTRAEIFFDKIPTDANGDIKTIFLMNTIEGMYIRNIKVNVPTEYETVATINLADTSHTWTHAGDTGLSGGNDSGTFSYDGDILKIADCYKYANHEVTLSDASRVYSNDMKIRFKVKATPNGTGMNNLQIRFFNYDTAGGLGDDASVCAQYTFTSQGEWETIELNLGLFLNDENKLKGFGFGTFGYGEWTTGQKYTIEFDKIEIVGEASGTQEISLADTGLVWTHAGNTGLSGGNDTGTFSYDGNILKIADCFAYANHEVTLSDTDTVYADGKKIRFKMRATPNGTGMNNLQIRFFNYDTEGGLGDDANVCAQHLFTSQGEWQTVEFDLDLFLNAENKFKGFGVGMFNYGDWTSGQKYTIEFDKIEIF